MPHKYAVKRTAVAQPSDPSYKIIPLTRGQNALVDTSDYDWLNQWNWYAHPQRSKDKRSGMWRARIANAWLGSFVSQGAAAHAYDTAAQIRFGGFAHLNVQSPPKGPGPPNG